MIFDWFHRKFIEGFLECENGDFRCPIIDKPFDDPKQNNASHSELREHRYRYFIPQVNPINPAFATGRDTNLKVQEEERKPETTFSRTSRPQFFKPDLYNRIRKFYIITSDKKTEAEVLKLSAALIKGVYPTNIRKFLVVPLSDDTSDSGISQPDKDLNALLQDQSKQDGDEEKLLNDYQEFDDSFEYKDLDEYIDDLFEEEYISTENIRDSLIRKPREQYDEDTWRSFRKGQHSSLPTINPQTNEIGTNEDGNELKDDMMKHWRQSEINGSWWCDLVDMDVPVTYQSLRSKLEDPSEVQETKSVFKSIFEKLFNTKTPDSDNEYIDKFV